MGNAYPSSTSDAISGHCPGTWKINSPIIGYKRIRCACKNNVSKYNYRFIAHLTVPKGAKVVRSEAGTKVSDKIRTNNFKINEIEAISATQYEKCEPIDCHSIERQSFKYEAGKSYQPDKLDERTNVECTNGLYFFLDKLDAINYVSGKSHTNDDSDGPVPPIGLYD
jgi:hypothetical protein